MRSFKTVLGVFFGFFLLIGCGGGGGGSVAVPVTRTVTVQVAFLPATPVSALQFTVDPSTAATYTVNSATLTSPTPPADFQLQSGTTTTGGANVGLITVTGITQPVVRLTFTTTGTPTFTVTPTTAVDTAGNPIAVTASSFQVTTL